MVDEGSFLGFLPPNGIFPGAKFTLRPSLAFSYIGSVTRTVGVSQTLRRGTRNGITELSVLVLTMTARFRIHLPCSCWERPAVFTTPIFSRAAITWYFRATCPHLLVVWVYATMIAECLIVSTLNGWTFLTFKLNYYRTGISNLWPVGVVSDGDAITCLRLGLTHTKHTYNYI